MQDIKDFLRLKKVDFEYFFTVKDQEKEDLNEYEFFTCELCEEGINHSKFRCPKLHYMPYHQTIIYKSLMAEKKDRNKRQYLKRSQNKNNAFKLYLTCKAYEFEKESYDMSC